MQSENLRRALEQPADMLILDEPCGACALGMVEEALLKKAVMEKPEEQELVLTGRDPAEWMQQRADYHTEMLCHKHPYEQGISARKGVEF